LNDNRRKKDGSKGSKEEETIDDGCEENRAIVHHVQMVTSLIEGRKVGLDEIHRMLNDHMRQHSIDSAGKRFYGDLGSQKTPP